MILTVSGWGEGGRLPAEVASCHEGGGASAYTSLGTRRAAKGTAASTSSQPQAVMDSSADTSAPLASQLAETRAWGALVETVFSKAHALQQRQPKQSGNQHEPKRTGSGCPHRRSGSEADSMSRGGCPVAGRPSSKSSSIGHIRSNEAVLTRTTSDTNQNSPGAGTPTGALEAKRTA